MVFAAEHERLQDGGAFDAAQRAHVLGRLAEHLDVRQRDQCILVQCSSVLA